MTTTMTAPRSAAAQAMLEEFEHELPKTRRFLERLPDSKLAWRAHEKSMSAGELAMHIALTYRGVAEWVMTAGGPPPPPDRPQPASTKAVLDELELGANAVRALLSQADDAWMRSIFTIDMPDGSKIRVPRQQFIRAVLFNHIYHHRGQFGVYLRLLGLPVPSAYGPSGDEMGGL